MHSTLFTAQQPAVFTSASSEQKPQETKGPKDNGEDLPGRLFIHFAQHPKHPYFYFICFVDCQHQLFKFGLRLLEPLETLEHPCPFHSTILRGSI